MNLREFFSALFFKGAWIYSFIYVVPCQVFLNKTSSDVLDSPEAGLSLNQYLENRMTNRASKQVLSEKDVKLMNYSR